MDAEAEITVALALVKEVQKLVDAKSGGDIYRQAYANVFKIPVEGVSNEQRMCVKRLSFGATMFTGATLAGMDGEQVDRLRVLWRSTEQRTLDEITKGRV